MKIAHIISNKVWGGGEQYVYDLCCNLISDGHDVEIFTRPISAIVGKVATLGVPIHDYSLKNILKLRDGIVHVHNFKDALKLAVAKKITHSNIKIVVTRHLVRPAKTSHLYTWVYANVEKIIFVSDLARKAFLSSQPKVDEAKLCVVRNSIKTNDNANSFAVDDIKASLPNDTTILMYHGRIAKEKGLNVLIDAVARLKDIPYHLFLVGAGDAEYTNELKQQIANRNISAHVSFLGFKDDVRPYISQTDIGIIPTIAQEACGLSCMEYMMLGKCLITTNNGGQAEYVENGVTGLLITPGDAAGLIAAIRTAITTKEAIGKKAKEYFDNYLSYDKFYAEILRIYRNAIK